MSTADEWDLTVPEDATDLMEELRRRGVVAEVAVRRSDTESDEDREVGPQRLSFTGIIHAEADLSTNTDRYLASFGRS